MYTVRLSSPSRKKVCKHASSSSPSSLSETCYMSQFLFFLLQMNVSSSGLCAFLFLLVRASSSWTQVFVNPLFPCKSLLPLTFCSFLLPISLYLSTYLSLCNTLLCISNLCNEKCSASLPIDNCEKGWKLWRDGLICWPFAGQIVISWADSLGTTLTKYDSFNRHFLSIVWAMSQYTSSKQLNFWLAKASPE